MSEFFYVEPSHYGCSQLSKMAEEIIQEAKGEYAYNVYHRRQLDTIVEELRKRANELLVEHPRWRMPQIKLEENHYTRNALVRIDDWSFMCHWVRRIYKEEQNG